MAVHLNPHPHPDDLDQKAANSINAVSSGDTEDRRAAAGRNKLQRGIDAVAVVLWGRLAGGHVARAGSRARISLGRGQGEIVIELAAVVLLDPRGRLLLQLRDDKAPRFPDTWGLPGGHCEPGETPSAAAARELWEETRLVADAPLEHFFRQELPAIDRVKHYFWGTTRANDDDIVVGEGAAILFVAPSEALDGRPLTPGTKAALELFLQLSRTGRPVL